MSAALDRSARIEAALVELLRLYDWRNELGRKERDFNHDRKQMKTWLNQYGREKKAAWAVARDLLTDAAPQVPEVREAPGNLPISSSPAAAAPHVQTDRCGFDRNASHSEDTYVCTCGWSIRV